MSHELREVLARVDGIEESASAFKDDIAYWTNGKEIAHSKAIARSTSG